MWSAEEIYPFIKLYQDIHYPATIMLNIRVRTIAAPVGIAGSVGSPRAVRSRISPLPSAPIKIVALVLTV
jgi:hypothetical protein